MGHAPVDSMHCPAGNVVLPSGVPPLANPALYSSMYTGAARPTTPTGFVASPTRTTMTELARYFPYAGEGVLEGVTDPVGVRLGVRDPVGVLVGVVDGVGVWLGVTAGVQVVLGVETGDLVWVAVCDAVCVGEGVCDGEAAVNRGFVGTRATPLHTDVGGDTAITATVAATVEYAYSVVGVVAYST